MARTHISIALNVEDPRDADAIAEAIRQARADGRPTIRIGVADVPTNAAMLTLTQDSDEVFGSEDAARAWLDEHGDGHGLTSSITGEEVRAYRAYRMVTVLSVNDGD
jgi:hypothetical protein